MIIFVNILLDKGVISNETFTATLLMAVASTMLSIPMVTPKLAKIEELILKQAKADAKPIPPVPQRAISGLVDRFPRAKHAEPS
jgi:hypothetical protein